MRVHLGEVIQFDTREGIQQGRLCRSLGGNEYIVETITPDHTKFKVRYLPESETWSLPHLLEARV